MRQTTRRPPSSYLAVPISLGAFPWTGGGGGGRMDGSDNGVFVMRDARGCCAAGAGEREKNGAASTALGV